MNKIILLSVLATFSTGAFAVDLSDMQAIVFVNESNDSISGEFKQSNDCDGDGTSHSLSGSGLPTIPSYDDENIYSITVPEDNVAYQCISLNGGSKSDDITIDSDEHPGEIIYDAGSSSAEVIVHYGHPTYYNAEFCYVEDVDGIDDNDDKYVWPSYENDTLTIHITDSAPPSSLDEC
ncbi:hypothetical protein V9N52_004296 [Vibrio navarrensis]